MFNQEVYYLTFLISYPESLHCHPVSFTDSKRLNI